SLQRGPVPDHQLPAEAQDAMVGLDISADGEAGPRQACMELADVLDKGVTPLDMGTWVEVGARLDPDLLKKPTTLCRVRFVPRRHVECNHLLWGHITGPSWSPVRDARRKSAGRPWASNGVLKVNAWGVGPCSCKCSRRCTAS